MRRILIMALALVPGVASAQFLTAEQVRPILDATKQNWVAVRLYDGRDLLYFSHLEAWRCGLSGVKYGLNGAEAITDYALAPCDEASPNPSALPSDHLPYVELLPYQVNSVTVEITYDDGKVDAVTFPRQSIELP